MLFNSLPFLLFFPAAVALQFLLPPRFRWAGLLTASAVFYLAPNPGAIIVIAAIIFTAYAYGRMAPHFTAAMHKKAGLIVCLLMSVMPLIFGKYGNLFASGINAAFSRVGIGWSMPLAHWVLPIGVSFFTFKALAYSIEVYKGSLQPERHAGKFALYISFFPQLLAGPIERPGRFLPQIDRWVAFDPVRVSAGLKRMVWGLFTKTVIADRLAVLVNRVYDNPADQSGLSLLIATYLFSFQIFCDFAGYSDMAIGAAKVLGFDTMENFQRPYFARSIGEFWRRWHISLSSWFRDYLYIPLGGNRTRLLVWTRNILIVFAVSGLWHGANATFVVWGALHGCFLIVGRITAKSRDRWWAAFRLSPDAFIRKLIAVLVTFHLAAFAWIFFRASSLTNAGMVIHKILTNFTGDIGAYTPSELLAAAALIAILQASHLLQRRRSGIELVGRFPIAFRWVLYAAAILAIINMRPEYQAPFMYMHF